MNVMYSFHLPPAHRTTHRRPLAKNDSESEIHIQGMNQSFENKELIDHFLLVEFLNTQRRKIRQVLPSSSPRFFQMHNWVDIIDFIW